MRLEAAYAVEEEDTHDYDICNGLFVSNPVYKYCALNWSVEQLMNNPLSACITSVLRTYYTWKIVQSPDISYNMVPMGMWTYAELSTGIVISCLPVIPKFFQHVGPQLSRALTFRHDKVTKESSNSGSSASGKSSDPTRGERLKLPSFKHTFASVVYSTRDGVGDHELCSQPSLPKKEYVMLHEETAGPKRNSARDLVSMPQVKVANTRDDLERGDQGL